MHCENLRSELSPAAVLAPTVGAPEPAVATDGPSPFSPQPANPTVPIVIMRVKAARRCFLVIVFMAKVLRADRSHDGHKRPRSPHTQLFFSKLSSTWKSTRIARPPSGRARTVRSAP